MLIDFEPQNDLEVAIVAFRREQSDVNSLMQKLVRSQVFISSLTEVQADGRGFSPVLLEVNDSGPLVAVFSSIDRPELHDSGARFILQMDGTEFFLRLPPQYGLVLNPGFKNQLVIDSDAARGVREGLSNTSR